MFFELCSVATSKDQGEKANSPGRCGTFALCIAAVPCPLDLGQQAEMEEAPGKQAALARVEDPAALAVPNTGRGGEAGTSKALASSRAGGLVFLTQAVGRRFNSSGSAYVGQVAGPHLCRPACLLDVICWDARG